MSRRPVRVAVGIVGAVALAASIGYLVHALDPGALLETARAAGADPSGLVLALVAYLAAFALRAAVWARILPGLGFGHALAAIHVGLAANHLLPFRLGEPVRPIVASRRTGVALDATAASTVMLRAADVLAVLALGAALGPAALVAMTGQLRWAVLLVAGAAFVAGAAWLRKVARRRSLVVRPAGLEVAAAALIAWLLESVVILQAAGWAGITLTPAEAALVTAVTIAAQAVAIAPGGIGTYEAAAAGTMVALGAAAGPALAAAVAAHVLKTVYALVAGGIGAIWPAPGLVDARRHRPAAPERLPASAPGCGPVLLFLPAHDEEATVAHVLERAPREVRGHRVELLVVDDGSADRTAARARDAGAEVRPLGANHGLGAAVRAGLAEGVARGAAAIVFCDADGEYAPDELERLVAPILAGEADYVVGSRFAGGARRMRPHRLVGNLLLTGMLTIAARRRIGDGQSGYRALSREAARHAEIVHDFNYAQVLTLDLLSKGARYREVPISYRHRTAGRSFVRPLGYLRAVIPAVVRELAGARDPASVLHDVVREPGHGVLPGDVVEPAVGAERIGGGPRHGQGVMGVVVREQALSSERHDAG